MTSRESTDENEVRMCIGILEDAIAFEDEGLRFYTERAERAGSRLERDVFLSLAKDELGHKTYLIKIRDDLRKSHDIEVVEDEGHEQWRPRKIFETALEGAADPYDPQPADLEILRGAMLAKTAGYQMYREAAKRIESEKARALFGQLAVEEQTHYELLSNTHAFLENPGDWYSFNEGVMLDGG